MSGIRKHKMIRVDTVNGIMVEPFFKRQVDKFKREIAVKYPNSTIEIKHDQKYPNEDDISAVILTADINKKEEVNE